MNISAITFAKYVLVHLYKSATHDVVEIEGVVVVPGGSDLDFLDDAHALVHLVVAHLAELHELLRPVALWCGRCHDLVLNKLLLDRSL